MTFFPSSSRLRDPFSRLSSRANYPGDRLCCTLPSHGCQKKFRETTCSYQHAAVYSVWQAFRLRLLYPPPLLLRRGPLRTQTSCPSVGSGNGSRFAVVIVPARQYCSYMAVLVMLNHRICRCSRPGRSATSLRNGINVARARPCLLLKWTAPFPASDTGYITMKSALPNDFPLFETAANHRKHRRQIGWLRVADSILCNTGPRRQ